MAVFNKGSQDPTTRSTGSASKTIITEGSFFKGDFVSKYSVLNGGVLDGSINVDKTLNIAITGIVKGSINADKVVIYGKVYGDIVANSIEVHKGGLVIGDIETHNISTDAGAIFEGRCKIIDSKYKEEILKISGVNSLSDDNSIIEPVLIEDNVKVSKIKNSKKGVNSSDNK